MNSRERIRLTLCGDKADRVPLVNIFSLSYLAKKLGLRGSLIKKFLQNPNLLIDFQESCGHDPVINLYSFQEPEVIVWPAAIANWGYSDDPNYRLTELVEENKDGYSIIRRIIRTPIGQLESLIRHENFQNWVIENPFKKNIPLEILDYRPLPEKINFDILRKYLKDIGGKAFSFVVVPGVWQEACSWRGVEELVYDLYDRREWVVRLLDKLSCYSVHLIYKLMECEVDCIVINESYVGLGMSPAVFGDLVLPFDKKIIEAVKNKGAICSYHVCGKSAKLLQLIADSGVQAIETLVPYELSGDVKLEEVKELVRGKVALWGGFNERVLAWGSSEDVIEEAKRCLDAAASGGGYILRGSGQIFEAKDTSLKTLAEFVHKYGSY